MKITIYSLRNKEQNGIDWIKGGYNIKYFRNNIKKVKILSKIIQIFRPIVVKKKTNFTIHCNLITILNLKMILCFFAMNYPYSFTRMINSMGNLVKNSCKNPFMY